MANLRSGVEETGPREAVPLAAQTAFSPSAEEGAGNLSVLVVEHHDHTRELLALALRAMGHRIHCVCSGKEALDVLREARFDLVLLDIMMPEMDGLELCRTLRAQDVLDQLHVIIVSARDTLDDKIQGLTIGAADYLTKPLNLTELKARVGAVERIVRAQKELRRQNDALRKLAREDKLTGLCTRNYFEERAASELLRARRYARPLSLALADLDGFKQVNDCYGHARGDAVLERVGGVLLRQCRVADIAARHGGEEFALLLPETTIAGALKTAERVRRGVRSLEFDAPSGSFRVTISLGVAAAGVGDCWDLARLLERADEALYRAKRNGRDRVERA